jgi:hypothetical protein
MKRRAVCRTDKPVSNVQRVIEAQAAFICCAKNREKYRDLNCACSVKPAIALQGESQAGLNVVERYRNRSSLPLGSQSCQLFT